MPKTNKKFDWEVYDGEEFLDILTMSRSEVSEYKKIHPNYTLKELGYTDDGGNDSWTTNSKERGNVHCVRIQKRRRKLEDVY